MWLDVVEQESFSYCPRNVSSIIRPGDYKALPLLLADANANHRHNSHNSIAHTHTHTLCLLNFSLLIYQHFSFKALPG